MVLKSEIFNVIDYNRVADDIIKSVRPVKISLVEDEKYILSILWNDSLKTILEKKIDLDKSDEAEKAYSVLYNDLKEIDYLIKEEDFDKAKKLSEKLLNNLELENKKQTWEESINKVESYYSNDEIILTSDNTLELKYGFFKKFFEKISKLNRLPDDFITNIPNKVFLKNSYDRGIKNNINIFYYDTLISKNSKKIDDIILIENNFNEYYIAKGSLEDFNILISTIYDISKTIDKVSKVKEDPLKIFFDYEKENKTPNYGDRKKMKIYDNFKADQKSETEKVGMKWDAKFEHFVDSIKKNIYQFRVPAVISKQSNHLWSITFTDGGFKNLNLDTVKSYLYLAHFDNTQIKNIIEEAEKGKKVVILNDYYDVI